MSTQPLLGTSHYSSYKGGNTWTRLLTSGITYDGLCLMLNEPENDKRDELTKNWRDHKLEELNFVGTVGALLAGCLASTGAWPDILNNGRDKPWAVRAIWHGGLVFALFSVLVAAQQSMRLHRLCAHRDGLELLRNSLVAGRREQRGTSSSSSSSSSRDDEDWKSPRVWQVWAWEASIAFLVASVLCTIAGLTILLWVSTEYGPSKPSQDGWWDENAKMAVTFTGVLGLSVLVFLGSQTALMGTGRK